MNDKSNYVAFVDKKLEEAFNTLKEGHFEDKQLYKFIERAKQDLLENPLKAGVRIQRKLIPQEYVQKYSISSLWKYDLPNAWRLLYTIVGDEIKIVSIILEWMTHKEYERRFNY
jgi:hypothetical protein